MDLECQVLWLWCNFWFNHTIFLWKKFFACFLFVFVNIHLIELKIFLMAWQMVDTCHVQWHCLQETCIYFPCPFIHSNVPSVSLIVAPLHPWGDTGPYILRLHSVKDCPKLIASSLVLFLIYLSVDYRLPLAILNAYLRSRISAFGSWNWS